MPANKQHSRHERENASLLAGDNSGQPAALAALMTTLSEAEAECIESTEPAAWELGEATKLVLSDSLTGGISEIDRVVSTAVVGPDASDCGCAYRYALEYACGNRTAIGDVKAIYGFKEPPTLLPKLADAGADTATGLRHNRMGRICVTPALHEQIGNP